VAQATDLHPDYGPG